ncbi:MAG: glycosyltransferase family 1 protein [Patescibacteria group bacterium]
MSNFRIGIDGNEANVDNRVGSNVYAFELMKQIEEQTRNNADFIFTIFLTNKPVQGMPEERTGWTYHWIKPKAFATQWGLPLALFKMRKELDLFFTPGHYAPRLCPIPYVSCVMDLGFLHFPRQFKLKDYWQLKLWTKYSVQKAKRIVAISEYTKQDLQKQYKIQPEKISVIYPAMNAQISHRENQNMRQTVFHKFKIDAPYILYVGTLQPRKNIVQLVEAFEHLKLKYQSEVKQLTTSGKRKKRKNQRINHPLRDLKLVIAGKTGWLAEPILNRIKKSVCKSDIILTGYVDEEEKTILYTHALCSILIGIHEGFGMPALESLLFHVVPVVSETTSLPEVVGEAGVLVNPYNSIHVMKGIDKALNLNQKERKEFEKRADNQLKKFTWELSAKKLLDIFTTLNK